MTTRAVSDEEAVEVMRPVAVHHARRLSRHNASLIPDMIQEGLMGAMEAAKTFDPECGVKFLTYAWRRVYGRMRDYLRDHEDHLTRAQRERLEGGDEPFKVFSLEAIADVKSRAGQSGGYWERGTIRHDPPHHDPEPADAPEAEFVAFVRRRFPGRATPDQLRLLAAYYVHDRRVWEIADGMGVSESRASQLMTETLTALNDGEKPAGPCGHKANKAGCGKRSRKAVPS